MKTTSFAVALVCSLTSIWACSAADPTTPNGSKESDSKSSDSKNAKSSSSSSSSSGSSATPPPSTSTDPNEPAPAGGQCTASQGEDACVTCCETKNQKGSDFEEQLDEAWVTCACAPAACATQCAATACGESGAEPAEGDACSTCLEQHSQCDTAWDTACTANADCAALQSCQEPCFPEEADEQDFRQGAPEQKAAAAKKHRSILQRHHAAAAMKTKIAR